jgi:hypothetical protein
VAVGSPREFLQVEKEDQEIAEACNRLIKNSIVCWNYLYLGHKLATLRDAAQKQALMTAIASHSMLSALAFEGGQGLDGRPRGDPRHLRGLDPTLTLVANSSAAMRHEPLRGSEPRSANIAWRLGACPPTTR